jgi:hypothetical protein
MVALGRRAKAVEDRINPRGQPLNVYAGQMNVRASDQRDLWMTPTRWRDALISNVVPCSGRCR